MRTKARIGLPVALPLTAALALIVAACSGGGATATSAAPTAAPATSAPSMAPESMAPESMAPESMAPSPVAGGETVTVAETDLGQILVDGEGRTLYLFTQDTDGESVCYDQCETNWPPLTVDGEVTVGAGLDGSSFSTVARTDGTMQVRIGDWPLYYFANDAAPGDTNGQGVGEVWYVVSPTGEAIQ